jgi:hypothetical protein
MSIFQSKNALTFELLEFSQAGCRHTRQMSIAHGTSQARAIMQKLEILPPPGPAAPYSSAIFARCATSASTMSSVAVLNPADTA